MVHFKWDFRELDCKKVNKYHIYGYKTINNTCYT